MSLCRRFFRQDLRLLGFSVLAIVVRPPGQVTVSKNPQTPFDEGLRAYERGAGVALLAGP